MPVRVLIVDDSMFFQGRLKDIISRHPQLEVVGLAANGQEAVEKTRQLRPDIITMDFEMPVMDGVTAVRQIMKSNPTPILMFSSLTYEGARITLDALEAGALDFIPKDFAEVSRNSMSLVQRLHERLLTLANKGSATAGPEVNPPAAVARPVPAARAPVPSEALAAVQPPPAAARPRAAEVKPRLVIIGASTGGPVALTEVLTRLPANFPVPIVLVQHMPESFTKAFAERLNRQCQIEVREAVNGESLKPGLALLAPGGKQMMLDKRSPQILKVVADDERVNYRPSLDITFGSAANAYGDKVLGLVLTGMGSDGCKGAEMLKRAGSHIWSQDEASSVIYGMPMAVARAGLSDRVLSLKDVGAALVAEVM